MQIYPNIVVINIILNIYTVLVAVLRAASDELVAFPRVQFESSIAQPADTTQQFRVPANAATNDILLIANPLCGHSFSLPCMRYALLGDRKEQEISKGLQDGIKILIEDYCW